MQESRRSGEMMFRPPSAGAAASADPPVARHYWEEVKPPTQLGNYCDYNITPVRPYITSGDTWPRTITDTSALYHTYCTASWWPLRTGRM